MKIVVAASSRVALPTIEHLQELGHDLIIATMPDRPAGRGLKLQPSEIGLHFPDAIRIDTETDLQKLLKGSELLLTVAYGRILGSETLKIPRFGSINLHFSLLPKWRGAAPVQRAIEAGDEVTGVSVFQMDSGMDTGPIWIQKKFNVLEGFTSTQLFTELSELGKYAVAEAVDLINSGEKAHPQSGEVSIAKKISKEECRLNWNQECDVLLRKIRAFSPHPGTYTHARGQVLKVLDAQSSDISLEPGLINDAGIIGTANKAIQLLTVKPAGKREMSVTDWLNGFKPQPGEHFE